VILRFDKDEGVIDEPSWFTVRLETIDKCKAAVLLLSKSYLSYPVSLFESKVRRKFDNVRKVCDKP